MSNRHFLLGLAAAVLVPFPVVAQQEPIFGCRHAINCRPSPVSLSALNDRGALGLLVSASVRWGPGFHFGLRAPLFDLRPPEPEIDIHSFHLWNATLLPPPEIPKRPTPAVTPPPVSEEKKNPR